MSHDQRTAAAYRPTWSTVWFAPTPRSSGGRSAVSASSGTRDWSASMTAPWKYDAAVPEVHSTGTTRPDVFAMPNARYAADRSSMRTCSRIRRSWVNASAIGVDRLPGASTASVTPCRTSSSTSTTANALPALGTSRVTSVVTRQHPLGVGQPLEPCGGRVPVGTDVGERDEVRLRAPDRQPTIHREQRLGAHVGTQQGDRAETAGVGELGQRGCECHTGGDADR